MEVSDNKLIGLSFRSTRAAPGSRARKPELGTPALGTRNFELPELGPGGRRSWFEL